MQHPAQGEGWGAAARAADGADMGGAEPALAVAVLVRDDTQPSSPRSLQYNHTASSHKLIPSVWMMGLWF